MEQPKPKKAKDHRVTQTNYQKQGNDWVKQNQDITMADEDYVRNVLSDTAQPFEQSHRLYKQGKGNYKHDTYESISPDGMTKAEWRVEYPGEFEIEEPKKPQPKEGSFEKMMQGFEQPKMATEKKAEQYHEPKPKIEMDEDYERSWGPEQKKDGYYKDNKGEIYLVEQGDTYYPVNEAERTEFFNAFNKQAQEAPKAEQPKEAPKQEAQTPEASLSAYFKDNSFKKSGYGDHNYENDSGEEYWVGTYDEAEEEAKQYVRNFIDDAGIGGFTEYFQDWINDYAVDENFIRQVQEEEADYFESEGDRDTAEWLRNTDPDNFQQYMVDTYGLNEWRDILAKNNAYDIDKIVDEAVRVDGIGHFLAGYDGEEVELPNGLYAYRQN